MTVKMKSRIPVMEIFGPTIQGEGMVVGRKTMFVRTAGCDYRCSWCDSAFTWDGTGKDLIRMKTPEEIYEKLAALGGDRFDHVTISGGNPALIGKGMEELIALLHCKGIKVGLETQGSKWQDWMMRVDDLTISPKPPSSGMDTNFTVLSEIIRNLKTAGTNFSLKVVVFDDDDFYYAEKLHSFYPTIPFYLSVGNIDPYEDGKIADRLLQKLDWLWGKVIDSNTMNDVITLPQLHTLVWQNKRGV